MTQSIHQEGNPNSSSSAVPYANHLVEGVGAGSPVGKEQAEADSLKDTGNGTDSNGVKRALLGDDLRDNLACVSFDVFDRRK